MSRGAERLSYFVREENRMRGNSLAQPTASSLAVGNWLASVELCFLLSCRWQPGPAVRSALFLAMPKVGCQFLGWLPDSGQFPSAFNALGIRLFPLHPKVIEPALFWNLQRLSGLSSDRGGLWYFEYFIPLELPWKTMYAQKPFMTEHCKWEHILSPKNMRKLSKLNIHSVIWFAVCFMALFFYGSEIIFLSTWLTANPLEGSLC